VRDGQRRIVVLQGLTSETERKKEAPRVMRAAFVDFKTSKLVDKGAEVAEADVWLGEKKTVSLVAGLDVSVGLHVSALKQIKSTVVYKGPLLAPVKEGDTVGELLISAPGMSEIKVPVLAGASVNKLGLIGRALVGLRGE
jgi:D-alanyl-D-alanine carboxypeptidase (penicillin-binding protein 5/6)